MGAYEGFWEVMATAFSLLTEGVVGLDHGIDWIRGKAVEDRTIPKHGRHGVHRKQ